MAQKISQVRILLVLLCILNLTFVNAQKNKNKFEHRFGLTIKAGANFSMIAGVGAQGFNHFGAVGGPQFNWRFSNKFSFNPEVLYSMKGGRRNPNPEAGDYYSFSVDLDYIELPTLFRWHFDKRDRFSLEFGPTFGFLVRNQAFENSFPVSPSPVFNLFDLSLAAGINFHLPKGWGFNARYTNSIIPIQPINGIPQTGNINIGAVNSLFTAALTYTIRFGEKKQVNDEALPETPKQRKVKKPKGNIYDED